MHNKNIVEEKSDKVPVAQEGSRNILSVGIEWKNLQHILVNYVMQTVLRGCNSPLEAIVFKYSDLYCHKIKSLNL